jgi:two-component system, cell cycle sensor histidine kinase and response regulator CckA
MSDNVIRTGEDAGRSQLERLAGERTAVLEQLGEGVIATDATGRIRFINRAAEQLFGRPLPDQPLVDLLGAHEFARPDGTPYPPSAQPFARALSRDQVTRSEDVCVRLRDGRELTLEMTAAPVHLEDGTRSGAVAIVRDVTAARRAVEALRESEARFRLMVEGSEQVFFYVHNTDGIFEYVSPSVEAVLGYVPEELVGRHYEVLGEAEGLGPEVRVRTDAALTTGEAQPPYMALNRHRSGRAVTVEITERPMVRGGEVVAMQGFARDVTARVQLERQLLQAQKMEAVGRLAGGIAHDFNNILTAIRGHAEMLLNTAEPGTDAYDDIVGVCSGADRAAALTRQLLAFSRRQVLQPRVIDLGKTVAELHSMFERLIGEHIELRVHAQHDLWSIRADPVQIEQVVLNLLVNARDAMPRGGAIEVDVHNFDHVAVHPAYPGMLPGRYVRLVMTDTGPGVDAAHLPHVFEPFFTTKAEHGGTGLGLATAYGIVKQSDGFIYLDNVPGGGCRVQVLLPPVEAAAEERPPLARPARALGGTETILLVEDEEPVRSLVRRVLVSHGYDVLDAPNGDTALDLVRGHDSRLHLLVTDVVMPGMSGSELADRLRLERADLRVLFMSGYSEEMIDLYRDEAAGEEFLEKPFTPFDLVRAVRSVLDGETV